MRKLFVALALAAIAAAGCRSQNAAPPPTPSVIMETNSIGTGSCEWQLRMYADNSFTAAEASDMGLALLNWNRASGGRICFTLYWMLLNPEYEQRHYHSDGMRTFYSGTRKWHKREASSGVCRKPGSCAAVTVWESKGDVADIFYFNRSRDGFRPLTEHEMGHVLGLDHSASERDIMYHRVGPKVGNSISPGDRKQLRCLMNSGQIGAYKNPCKKTPSKKHVPMRRSE